MSTLLSKKARSALAEPLFNDNPVARQVLGICSALAVPPKCDVIAASPAVSGLPVARSVHQSAYRAPLPM
jgi:Na+-transporting NADH:ubiquinone oxidoreductase subunit NqrD